MAEGFAFGLFAGIVFTLACALWLTGADLVDAISPLATMGAAIAAACSAWISSRAARHSEQAALEGERQNLLQQIITASHTAQRKSQRVGRLYQATMPMAYVMFPTDASEQAIRYYQGLENDVDAYQDISTKLGVTWKRVLTAHDAHEMGVARREFIAGLASILEVDGSHENRRRNAVKHKVIVDWSVEEDLDPLKVTM